MRLKSIPALVLALLFSGAIYSQNLVQYVDYVDSRLGTYQDGSNCVIGPQLPFGSINPSPHTPNGEHDGYHPDYPIRGFGQLHVSGIGWGKYGQFLVSPQIGLAVGEEEHDSPKENETAHPYEYGVTLSRYDIQTTFTPSVHSAIYRFVFPKSDDANILIDLSHNIPQDIATMVGGEISKGTINIDQANASISGHGVYSGGFGGGDYPLYFSAVFNKMPTGFGTWKNGVTSDNSVSEKIDIKNDRVGAFIHFETQENDTIYMKIAVSFKSIERANDWLLAEIPDFNYEVVKTKAITTWENQLEKIKIEGASADNLKIFYSAMYHSMLMPRNRTNDMRGFDDNVEVWDDHFAVWDTWRCLYPLHVLINPDVVSGTVNSFIERFKKTKMIKDAYVAGNDMIEEQGGNNIDNIIVDAYVKGIDGVNWDNAYEIIKHHAESNRGRLGWQGWGNTGISSKDNASYKTLGWIPGSISSCSYTLEYAYNDYCAGLMASGMGKNDDAKLYFNRSTKWINLWDSTATSRGFEGFIVPKSKDGEFIAIDLEKNWGSWSDYFYEGSSWTYSYFTPHQFGFLVDLMGGKEEFANRLKYGLDNNLIDYTNEPAFIAIQSFLYAGRPDLTSYYARKLLTESFTTRGVPGNDDSGAMSSWYIFSSMGLFPNAGQDKYYLFGAMFDKATIELGNGKQLIVEAENASKENLYVQSCSLNGKDWDKAWILHDSIKNGAVIKFVMGNKPSEWAKTDTTISHGEVRYDATEHNGLKSSQLRFSIFPNPFKNKVFIQTIFSNSTSLLKLKVINNQGTICSEQLITNAGNGLLEFDGSHLSSGLYHLMVEGNGEWLYAGKIVKNWKD